MLNIFCRLRLFFFLFFLVCRFAHERGEECLKAKGLDEDMARDSAFAGASKCKVEHLDRS